jgi:hypothetical protein
VKSPYAQSIEDLLRRAAILGNHHRKYFNTIEKHAERLLSLIIDKGWDTRIYLTRLAPDPHSDLQNIRQVANPSERLDLLACYYALQLLVLNLKAVEVLRLRLGMSNARYEIYRQFLLQTGNDFRRLTAAYMTILLDDFLPAANRPEFVMCGVGTRVDQDDIDLGIIDTGATERVILTRAFGQLNTAMLKSASTLHFHLSEHVGTGGYSACIDDYHRLLDRRIGDCVILSEMLNAVPILGSQNLFAEFKSEILERYFFQLDGNNKYHEGFLRGILGEVRDLLYRNSPEGWLQPKRDALRMIKALLFAFKTWKHIDRTTSLEVLQVLRSTSSHYKAQFEQLHQALTFFETFRFLYQLFIVQEEEIDLHMPTCPSNLQQVANYLGYNENQTAPAYQLLLFDYDHHRRLAHQATAVLFEVVYHHLQKISSFHYQKFYQAHKDQTNLPLRFIQQARFYEGVRFWDDVLTQLFNPNKILLRRFIHDFAALPPYRQKIIRQTYLQWGYHTPNALMILLNLMSSAQPDIHTQRFYNDLLVGYIKHFPRVQEKIDRFFQILNFAPRVLNDFIAFLPDQLLRHFHTLINETEAIIDDQVSRRVLLKLVQIYLRSSRYFRLFLKRALQAYPHYIRYLTTPERLSEVATGLWYELDSLTNPEETLRALGAYYDFEFMATGLALLNGTPIETINQTFTEFSDNYLRCLFEIGSSQLADPTMNEILREHLALLLAGGHGRQQAFDDDYDLIALLDIQDPDLLEQAEKLLRFINRHLLRRSIMPHYHFTDYFGRYTTTFADLQALLPKHTASNFIDKSLLFGARLVIGNANLVRAFQQQIIQPFILNQKEQFVADLINEISNRRHFYRQANYLNVKENAGGLRDFENCIFCLATHYNFAMPVSGELIDQLQNALPTLASTLGQLWQNYLRLKHIRDLNRIIVATDDLLHPESLADLIPPLNLLYHLNLKDAQELLAYIQVTLQTNESLIDTLLSAIGMNMPPNP